MMENFDATNTNYTSDLVNNLLGHISSAEQDQVDHKMKMAAKIHAGLKAKGWKSLDLARELHLKSPSLVSKWLSGTHNFTMDTLVDIQRVLGIRLLDADMTSAQRALNVNVTLPVVPSSLKEAIRDPLHKIAD
ncbi:multiprotein-bridging factor 1 family protein [Chitinophaga filiformis]|uniref:Helix-turn-helix domain-containing protein n=1 Tax=Chitinophaga filiformis TaxID=104663 RepID=A0ABY4I920_CHIFI|nr:helix-turn-helix transcriptional regulator [Chitinophaga filiformis]UPK72588.1 helix-turn-helix domain-containing protein [Chitinophaga filiformis]